MVRLKNLLFENKNNRANSLSLSKAVEIYRKNCKSHNNSNTQIYRGVYNKPEMIYINPKKSERESPSSSGFYSLIMDNSGLWSGYPKRKKSLICSTSRSYASNFGTPYLIVPFDDSNFGICSDDDIWRSFDFSGYNEFGDLSAFDSHLNEISKVVLDKKLPNRFNEFRSMINKIGRKAERGSVDLNKSSLLEDYVNSNVQDFLFYLEGLLSPDKNGFKNKNYDSSFNIFANKELWTDGECLMIKNSEKDKFLKEI